MHQVATFYANAFYSIPKPFEWVEKVSEHPHALKVTAAAMLVFAGLAVYLFPLSAASFVGLGVASYFWAVRNIAQETGLLFSAPTDSLSDKIETAVSNAAITFRLVLIQPDERAFVARQTRKLINTSREVASFDRVTLLKTLSEIPINESNSVVEQALRITGSPQYGDEETRNDMVDFLAKLPSTTRELFITEALRLFNPNIDELDRVTLLLTLRDGRFDIAALKVFVTQALKLFTPNIDGATACNIVESLCWVLKDERDTFIDQALRFAPTNMANDTRQLLIFTLANTPANKREALITSKRSCSNGLN